MDVDYKNAHICLHPSPVTEGGELVHFKGKAIVAARGSTCLPEATAELTEMATFAYSLCGIALRLGNAMPAQDCKSGCLIPFYGNQLLLPMSKKAGGSSFKKSEVNSERQGQIKYTCHLQLPVLSSLV